MLPVVIVMEPVTDFLVQLVVSLVGGGVGAIIGVYFGLRFARNWDRHKRSEEAHGARVHVINSLISELNSNHTQLSQRAAIVSGGFIGIHVL